MPFCKSCGARISKFDKDICPICGVQKPIEGATSDTIEVTSELDIHSKDIKKIYAGHFKLTAFLWFVFLGFTGAGWFYLAFKKRGVIWLVCNLVVLGGLIGLFGWLIGFNSWIAYLAPVAVVYLVNMAIGVFYLVKNDTKDGNGEFIH